MFDKAKKSFPLLIFVTIILVLITTIFAFPSSVPSSMFSTTPSPTSTTVPHTPISIFTATITLTPAYTATPTLPSPSIRNPNIKFPNKLSIDEWIITKESNLPQIESKYKEYTYEYDAYLFPSPLIRGTSFYDSSANDSYVRVVYNQAMLNGLELKVKEECQTIKEDNRDSKSSIAVLYGGSEINRIDAGDCFYTNSNVWVLWTYQNQWILEYISAFNDSHNRQNLVGNIVWNGKSLNHKFGYQESFGLTTINGRIFYFFRKNNQIGISYDGMDYNLGYESVDHYECCEYGMYRNPQHLGWSSVSNQNVRFFAKRNGVEYLVVVWTK